MVPQPALAQVNPEAVGHELEDLAGNIASVALSRRLQGLEKIEAQAVLQDETHGAERGAAQGKGIA